MWPPGSADTVYMFILVREIVLARYFFVHKRRVSQA